MSPWGVAYPVLLQDEKDTFEIEKEANYGFFSYRTGNVFWMAFTSIVIIIALLTVLPTKEKKKTEQFAPIELSHYLSTREQKTSFSTIKAALADTLMPWQPISIDSAVTLPVPTDENSYHDDLLIPPLHDWTDNVRKFSENSMYRREMLVNPYFEKMVRKPMRFPDGSPVPDTIIYEEEVNRILFSLDSLFNQAVARVDTCLLSDSKTYYRDIMTDYQEKKPLEEIYKEVAELCDTIITPKKISGLLKPLPGHYVPKRGALYIDTSRTGYPPFSIYFLPILYAVSLLLAMYHLYHFILNRIIKRKISRIHDNVLPKSTVETSRSPIDSL
jgi:hypothetical protein